MAVAADALPVADRFRDGLAERDADVLDRMVIVDVRVPMRFDVEIDETMARDLVEHMVEKRDARRKLLPAGAVEVDLHTDLRFAGVANDLRHAHGVSLK